MKQSKELDGDLKPEHNKSKRIVQGVPQSQATALPRYQNY